MKNWVYEITSGRLSKVGDDGSVTLAGIGWAGQGVGKNNPGACNLRNVGPIPPGWYTIGGPVDDPHTGKFSIPLWPDPSNDMMGRSGFRMHGANARDPEHSSEGCIIQQRPTREAVHASGCNRLQVIP